MSHKYNFILFFILTISCSTQPGFSKKKEIVIFDTDTAYLNDDGLALAMLLNHRDEVKVEGLTIMPGNEWPEQGVEYMFRTLELMNSEVTPVYMGAPMPFVQNKKRAMSHLSFISQKGRWWHGAFSMDRIIDKNKMKKPYLGFTDLAVQKEHAVDFMIKTIEKNPHNVTIMALGPLTNIALLIKKRPDLIPLIKQTFIMGGNLNVKGNATEYAEFNFWFDPEAAKIVLESSLKNKVLFALDITNQAVITRKDFFDIVEQPYQTPLMKYYKHSLGYEYPRFISNPQRKSTYVWDVLPILYLINPNIVSKDEEVYLNVSDYFDGKLEKSRYYGRTNQSTKAIRNGQTKTKFAKELDLSLFHQLYKKEIIKK